ncbi:MAG: glycosyltransferase family 4 protein [Prevotella sp.]|nr:glycosyltransferase family 4 protein [Prevotella sp.]
MKIVHIFWGLTYGGIETMLVNIANQQVKQGAAVDVVIINDYAEPDLLRRFQPEVGVWRINRHVHTHGLGFIRRINKVLTEVNPDVIHLHGCEIRNFISGKVARKAKIVATLHAIPTGDVGMRWRWGNILQKMATRSTGNVWAINRMDQVYSISKTVSDLLKEQYGISSLVVHNGINTSAFVQRECRLPISAFRIVQVSRLNHEVKGQDLLLEAVSRLKEKYHAEVQLTFIGDGPSETYLKEMVNRMGLRDQVTFLGAKKQDEIAACLCDYDLFVQPSRNEGFGLTVAEAMASNVPVLVSEGQGPAEVTCADTYGWTFRNGSSEDLARQLLYIMKHYDEALSKTPKARQHVIANYDVAATAKKYLEAYKK